MTISRKEFHRYALILQAIIDTTDRLRHTPWWRPGEKNAYVRGIGEHCSALSEILQTRVSKPRPRNPVEIASTGSHDA